MQIDVAIQTGPISGNLIAPETCGAVVRFEGRVRPEENGAVIRALNYEAHQPMARVQIEKIIGELAKDHPCEHVRVRHRIGTVPAGEMAILVEACSPHRAQAFALVSRFMDRLKQDVPIWKMEAVS